MILNATGNNITYGPTNGTTTIIGDLTINGSATGTINLRNVIINGNLTVNTPNADFIVEASTEVTETTTINDVPSDTFTNKGTLGTVIIADGNGTHLVNEGNIEDVIIDTNGDVTLDGDLKNVVVKKAAKVKVQSGNIISLKKVVGAEVNEDANIGHIDILPETLTQVLNDFDKKVVYEGNYSNKLVGYVMSINKDSENSFKINMGYQGSTMGNDLWVGEITDISGNSAKIKYTNIKDENKTLYTDGKITLDDYLNLVVTYTENGKTKEATFNLLTALIEDQNSL